MVFGVRLSISYLLTLSMVVFRITVLFFVSLIRNPVRPLFPPFAGSSQDIPALSDVMLLTVSFDGLSGNKARKKEDHRYH